MELLLAFAAAMIIQYVMFIPAFILKTDKLTDLSYGLSFIILTLLAVAFTVGTPKAGHIILATMIILWVLRLIAYLFARIRYMKRDKRFDGMRESFPRFLGFWTLQGLTVFAVMIAPLLYFGAGDGMKYGLAGIIIFAIGLIVESIADRQKSLFKRNVKNKERWINTGLWKYSRHPNYLGEMLVWIGVCLFVLPGLVGIDKWLALISPLFIIVLLLFVSGIPLLEKSANKKWGKNKEYLAYKKNTPSLIPYQTLIFSIVICLLAGAIGGLSTNTGPGTWYANIVKPSFNPPNWIFGPVWSTLYIMMGVSLYLAIKKNAGKTAFTIFGAQLILNTLWSIFFFGFESPGLALICIVALWLSILACIITFYKTSKTAAYLLVPYILWVSFATVLNAAIFILN